MASEIPILTVVTGRPGSGKSTLAQRLAAELQLPLVSRDKLKEGFLGLSSLLPMSHDPINKLVFEWFFAGISTLLSEGSNVIAEAAFQHHVWTPQFEVLASQAEIRLIICDVPGDVAFRRVEARFCDEPGRATVHPLPANHRGASEPFVAPNMPFPTLIVDTSDGYLPSLEAVIEFARPVRQFG